MKKRLFFMVLAVVWVSTGSVHSEQVEPGIVPFEMSAYHLVVKGRINGSENEYLFIVDTGARTMLDPAVVDELHLKKRGFQAKINTLTLSGFRIENIFCFTTFPFHLFKESGYPVRGIIGSDLMSRYKVTFDFKSRKILFSSDFSAVQKTGNGIYFQFETHPVNLAPVVPFKTGDKEKKGMIDTGQPYPLVFPMGDYEKMEGSEIKDAITSSGIIVKWPGTRPECNYLARLNSCRFGDLEVRNLVCLFGEIPPMLSMPLIGNEFLSRFTMIINYPRKELLLVPGEKLEFDSNRTAFGLALRANDRQHVLVEGIWKGSPADRAGIHVGDRVVQFEKKDVTGDNYSRLLNVVQNKEVASLTLGVKKDGGIRTVTLNRSLLLRAVD